MSFSSQWLKDKMTEKPPKPLLETLREVRPHEVSVFSGKLRLLHSAYGVTAR